DTAVEKGRRKPALAGQILTRRHAVGAGNQQPLAATLGQEASRFAEPMLAPREHNDPVRQRPDTRHIVGDRAGEDHEPTEEREKNDARGCGEDSACSWQRNLSERSPPARAWPSHRLHYP